MSKPSYYDKYHRHFDAPADITRNEDHEEERRDILPPPAHASSSSSFMISSSPSPLHSLIKLPSDISFIPVGINYSTADSMNDPKNDFHADEDVLELPKTEVLNDERKSYFASCLRSRQSVVTSKGNEYSSPAQILRVSSNSSPSNSTSFTSSHSYNVGFSAPPSRSSPMLDHSSTPKSIPHSSIATISGIPSDITVWDVMPRRTSIPLNTRSSVSPTFTTPQISSKPFSFSPLPELLPPFNASLLPLPSSSNPTSGSTSTLPIGIVCSSPSTIFKHSTSNDNNNLILDSMIHGPAAVPSIFSNFSSNNSSPSNSRCATPTKSSLCQNVSQSKTFIVPGYNVQNTKSNTMNMKKSHDKAANMVHDIIGIVTEEMLNDAISSHTASDNSSGIANQSKYNHILSVLQDMEKDIRPSYAGSKSSIERLKRGIVQSRLMIRETLAEIERESARNNSEERPTTTKYPKMD